MGTSYISATDMFCGAGGTTTGATRAGVVVRMAMNHWRRAIETHNSNYPTIDHALADISQADPRHYPHTTLLLASPECTNHSLAKGRVRKGQGQPGLWESKAPDPSEERSRCTMWDPVRFAEYHKYEIIILENVVDARHWRLWDAWLHAWQTLDYEWEIVYHNSMFSHPTPQSRDRMYVVLWRRGNKKPNLKITPLAYCTKCEKNCHSVQSWKDPLRVYGKYGKHGQYLYRCPTCATQVTPYYYCAANAIDWSLPAPRIGDRKRPLEEKTIRRIKLGLEKFRQDGFIVQINKSTDRVRGLSSDVLPTQTAVNGLAFINPFIVDHIHGFRLGDITQAMPTFCAMDHKSVVVPPFIMNLSHGSNQSGYIYETQQSPFPAQTCRDDIAVAIPPFMVVLRSHSTVGSLEEPLPTMCAGGEHHALITPPQPFIIDHIDDYRLRSISDPLSTIVAGGNHQSVVIPPPPAAWLMSYYKNGSLSPVEAASPTITTLERHALVTAGSEQALATINYEDCGFRMLEPGEIQAAMAFPRDYIITGNRREQVRQLGNAVTPPVMEMLVKRCIAALEGESAGVA